MEPIIVLRRVCRRFHAGTQTLAVLSDISLTFHRGEMVAIVGASGSGKSTLMNIIGCLDKPTSGEVLINGLFRYSDPGAGACAPPAANPGSR